MSLLLDAYETCVLLSKQTEPDGYGGYSVSWSEGAEFQAAIVLDSSTEAKVAAASGAKNLYTVITPKATNLLINDVFKRLSDDEVFRVTSDGTDKKTPQSAALDMRITTAQEFTLTGDTTNG